ncbi:MAG: hypothetical protein MI976_24635 [Pseudomonadales bacterium]|nr:hypothetical protein [Pseudomonadales bacterium]
MPDPSHQQRKRSKAASAWRQSNVRLMILLLGVLAAMLSGCEQQNDSPRTQPAQPSTPEPIPVSDQIRQSWNHYHIHGVHVFAQPVACIAKLKVTIRKLIEVSERSPNQEHLDSSRQELNNCRQLYQQTQLFVAANNQTQSALNHLHQRIGAPLEMPGYIDAIDSYPYSGIVNDSSMPLTKEELIRQHGLTDVSDVSLGFSVVNFLLWGEHHYNNELTPRPVSDFNPVAQWQSADYELGLGELDIKEHPNNRRRRYLEIATLILEEDLNQLATTWNKNTLPPLTMALADQIQTQVRLKIAEHLQAITLLPQNAQTIHLETTHLDTLVPLFSGADIHLGHWLKIDPENGLTELTNPATTEERQLEILTALFVKAPEKPDKKPL